MPVPDRRTAGGTALGLVAILCWGMSVAFTREVAEGFGAMSGMALAYAAGGGLGCVWQMATGRFGRALAMPRAYHLVCGGLMVAYGLCYSLAIGLARDRQTVLEIGILNYLWPGLSMLLAVPILRRRARPLLVPGVAIAFAGAALAVGQGGGFSWAAFGRNLLSASAAHVLALAGAVLWALYSNFNTRLAAHADGEAAPLHLVAMGAGLAVLRLATGEHGAWHPDAASWCFLAATALLPCLLGYLFWDIAMRRGHLAVVVPASYATPLISTLLAGVVLGVRVGGAIWLACGLVIGGAVLCRLAVQERQSKQRNSAAAGVGGHEEYEGLTKNAKWNTDAAVGRRQTTNNLRVLRASFATFVTGLSR